MPRRINPDNSKLQEECARSLENYGDLAAAEALTRALVAERSHDRKKACFWIEVFKMICEYEAQQS